MSEQPEQLSNAELKNMPPEAIAQALEDGQLAALLAGRDPGRVGSADQGARGPAETHPTAGKSPEQIMEALKRGELDEYLGTDNASLREAGHA